MQKGLPAIIGLSLITIEGSNWSEKLSKYIKLEAKNNPPHITLGNFFPTLQPKRALDSIPSADSVVRGEGEYTLLELASSIVSGRNISGVKGIVYRVEDGIKVNREREKIQNLDNLPFPEHYGARYQLTEFAIEGSRGCYCKCSFCGIDPFIQADSPLLRWRQRSPVRIVEEIKDTRKKYPNVDLYRFIDADFIGAPRHIDRLREFIKELSDSGEEIGFIIDSRTNEVVNIPKEIWRDLRDVGLREVYLGVETAIPEIKRMMRKGSTIENDQRAINILNDLGIRTRFGWMMITPWTTEEDIEYSAKILRNLGFARLDKYFQEMNLIPGTDAMEMMKKTARIWPDGDTDYFTYEVPARIDNLRRMGRRLVHNHQNFLERFMILHRDIDNYDQTNTSNLQELKVNLNDLNLYFFLTIFSGAKELGVTASQDEINDLTANIVKDFEPRIKEIEQKFKSWIKTK